MKIVYVSQEFPPSLRAGGIASYLKEITLGMRLLGHDITVIAANDDTRKSSDIVENGIRIIRLCGGSFFIPSVEGTSRLKQIKKWRCLYRFWSYRKKVYNAIQKYGPFDLIEVAEFGCEGLYLNDIGIPIVYRLHTASLMDHSAPRLLPFSLHQAPVYIQGKLELKVLRDKARYISSCSEAIKRWTENIVMNQRHDIQVIYNPIQIQHYEHEAFVTKERHLSIFYAGTICDWKGVGDLYETGKILKQRGYDFTLTMAGKISSYADKLQPQPWLNMLGKISREDVMKHYSKADVVCFPSWWENMPMVCIEAMMCGAIVIGSSSGGMSEIITDEVNGFLLPPKSPELWADKIADVCKLSIMRKQEISNNAQCRIRNNFSLDVISRKMEKFYIQVVEDYNSI